MGTLKVSSEELVPRKCPAPGSHVAVGLGLGPAGITLDGLEVCAGLQEVVRGGLG